MQSYSIFVFLIAVVISRIVAEKGYRKLSDEEKLRLMNGFSKNRMYSLLIFVLMAGGMMYMLKQTSLDRGVAMGVYLLVIAVYILVSMVINLRKVKSLEMPAVYRKSYAISQVVSLAGLAVFFYGMMLGKI